MTRQPSHTTDQQEGSFAEIERKLIEAANARDFSEMDRLLDIMRHRCAEDDGLRAAILSDIVH